MIDVKHGKLIVLTFAALFIMSGCYSRELRYQNATDMKRVEDVHYIAGLTEEFYEKTGRYPLSERRSQPSHVYIIRREFNVSIPTVPLDELERELEQGLGRDIELPVDPQKVDVWGGPRYYQYSFVGNDYFVSARLFYRTEYTRALAEYTHKYSVSSASLRDDGIVRFKDVRGDKGGRRVDEELQKKLYDAVNKGGIEEADRLFAEGALTDPVCPPNMICKALAWAADLDDSDLEMMEFLISKGADLDGGNAYGDTPLIYALIKEKHDVVRLLVRKGADVNKPNDYGMTPFIGVCFSGDADLVEMFMEHGAELNKCYPGRNSRSKWDCNIYPLIAAAAEGHVEVVRLLLKHGADTGVRDDQGKTALDYAREKSNSEMEELLKGYRR